MKRIIFSLCLVLMWGASTLDGEAAPADSLAWPAVTNECRPWCFWWWMGSAVDPPNLTRELTRYRNAGQGGVHIIPIYGAEGWEDRSIDYLSPEWLAMLEYTIREAHRLGMGVDMTTGTGWCFGGPQVPVQEGGLKVMAKVFDVPAGGTLRTRLDRDRQIALSAFSSSGRFVDLRDQVGPTSRVQWPAGDTAWKVYAVSWKSTGLQVKRAAPGGEGLMINPFYGEAMRHYLDSFTDALASYPGPRPRCLFQDSYEYFGCDWSPDLLDEFARRRGYRLETQFPLLFGAGTDDRTARIKGDYRETLSDLMVEHHAAPWVDWSHRQGCRTRYQAHGSPGNLLDLYAAADIPETEMFHKDREPLVAKFASSAAHVTGKPLASSETGTWLGEHFTVTLDDLKRLVDLFFVSGINHVVYHGTCYSPDEVP